MAAMRTVHAQGVLVRVFSRSLSLSALQQVSTCRKAGNPWREKELATIPHNDLAQDGTSPELASSMGLHFTYPLYINII